MSARSPMGSDMETSFRDTMLVALLSSGWFISVMTSNDWANHRQSKFKNSVLAEPRRVQVATLVLSY